MVTEGGATCPEWVDEETHAGYVEVELTSTSMTTTFIAADGSIIKSVQCHLGDNRAHALVNGSNPGERKEFLENLQKQLEQKVQTEDGKKSAVRMLERCSRLEVETTCKVDWGEGKDEKKEDEETKEKTETKEKQEKNEKNEQEQQKVDKAKKPRMKLDSKKQARACVFALNEEEEGRVSSVVIAVLAAPLVVTKSFFDLPLISTRESLTS